MIIKNLPVLKMIQGRYYVGRKPLSHIVWNENNPKNMWRPGYVVHHKDSNTLNDSIGNLILVTRGVHNKLHKIGTHHSEESKLKNRLSNLGKKLSEETKRKMSKSAIGKIRSEETRRKMAISKFGNKYCLGYKNNLGNKHSIETKKKMSESTSGTRNPMYGKHHSEETKRKISEANKGKTGWPKGKKRGPPTEETKLKIVLTKLKKDGGCFA